MVTSLIELKIEDGMVPSLEKSKMTRCHPQFYYAGNATMNSNDQKLHLHSIHKGILGVCNCQTYRAGTQATFDIDDVTVSSLAKVKDDTVTSLTELKIEDGMVPS